MKANRPAASSAPPPVDSCLASATAVCRWNRSNTRKPNNPKRGFGVSGDVELASKYQDDPFLLMFRLFREGSRLLHILGLSVQGETDDYGQMNTRVEVWRVAGKQVQMRESRKGLMSDGS